MAQLIDSSSTVVVVDRLVGAARRRHIVVRAEVDVCAREVGTACKPSARLLKSDSRRGPKEAVALQRECAFGRRRGREEGREVSDAGFAIRRSVDIEV